MRLANVHLHIYIENIKNRKYRIFSNEKIRYISVIYIKPTLHMLQTSGYRWLSVISGYWAPLSNWESEASTSSVNSRLLALYCLSWTPNKSYLRMSTSIWISSSCSSSWNRAWWVSAVSSADSVFLHNIVNTCTYNVSMCHLNHRQRT